ncbi:MAG: hypothetical protein U0V54_09160 [Saprospiraceae bacterium]|jgi:hypothetical protein|nr:hypothetical protein [Saprospiraceae bacterium]
MSGQSSDYGKKGAAFGKIMLGIILFIILLIYLYHHPSNNAPVIQ